MDGIIILSLCFLGSAFLACVLVLSFTWKDILEDIVNTYDKDKIHKRNDR